MVDSEPHDLRGVSVINLVMFINAGISIRLKEKETRCIKHGGRAKCLPNLTLMSTL